MEAQEIRESALPTLSLRKALVVFLGPGDGPFACALREQLQPFGCDVVGAVGEEELYGQIEGQAADAVFLDLDSPEITSFNPNRFNDYRRQRPRFLPLLVFSGQCDLQRRMQAVRLGGNAFLRKPFDMCETIEKLSALTDGLDSGALRLLVAADASSAAQYSAVFQNAGFETQIVADWDYLLEGMLAFEPDVLLLDPSHNGPHSAALCGAIRQHDAFTDLPIVCLIESVDVSRQTSYLGYGVDALVKPVIADHLVEAVTNEARRAREKVFLRNRDGLTGIYKLSEAHEQLEREILLAERHKRPLSVAILDVDGLRHINASQGIDAGDQVLRSLSSLLRQRLRRTDILGRIGGEEFLIGLPDSAGPASRNVMSALLKRFAEIRHKSQTGEFSATLSCGIADFPACRDTSTLLERARRGLEVSKSRGPGEVFFLSMESVP